MSVTAWLMASALCIVLATGALTLANLRRYRHRWTMDGRSGEVASLAAPQADRQAGPLVSVCIPARNEEANLEEVVRSLLAQDWPSLEVLVYDDQSTDATPAILARLCEQDARVRRADTHPLPSGWNGKQHACWRMSSQARGEWMLFTDADVRFEPGCVSRAVGEAEARGVGLLSTFPRQLVGSPGEALMVPMIFFLLFSYLPMGRMRRTSDPSASAGCGQFLFIRRDAYDATGGHEGFKGSMHDGIMLPRAVRRAEFRTDLFDATDLCRVRMYQGWSASWRGFAKNAYEGLGSVGQLVFLSVCTVTAHVLPWLVLVIGATETVKFSNDWVLVVAGFCVLMGASQRAILAQRFGHPVTLALLHPFASAMMMGVQWHSLYLHVTGKRAWKGRVGAQERAAG